jgi:hypothetical protein
LQNHWTTIQIFHATLPSLEELRALILCDELPGDSSRCVLPTELVKKEVRPRIQQHSTAVLDAKI